MQRMEDLQQMLFKWFNMSLNSSLFPDVSHDPLNSFLSPQFYKCSKFEDNSVVFITFTCTSFLLILPLVILVLYVGIQRWLQQRRSSTTLTVTHSDFLTHNIIVMEPIGLLGSGLCCCGAYMKNQKMVNVGVYTVFIIYAGRLLFQCLICVEQYLAVIHPVTYLSLKNERGIRVRNICTGCIWLVILLMLSLVVSYRPDLNTIPFFTVFGSGLLVTSFCSLSVLFALIRPGPGEVGGDRKRACQSKKKAFHTIVAITGVTFLKYTGLLVCMGLYALLLDSHDRCVALMSGFWFCLPSSLSLPLMFLYRTGKCLPCFPHKVESG